MSRFCGLFAAFWCVLATAAYAETTPVVHLDDPTSVQDTLQAEGFRAKLFDNEDGRPTIESGVAGWSFQIVFFGCESGKDCAGLNLIAGFELDNGIELSTINEWNLDTLLGRGFLDAECDPWIDHFVYTHPEQPVEYFVALIEEWGVTLQDFTDFIGFNDEDPTVVVSCDGDTSL